MDQKTLDGMLQSHKLWLQGEDGSRADLSKADLSKADLCKADLRKADLQGADLRGADLREADLYRANLYRADLREVDLYRANLRGADLREADLREADLQGATINWDSHELIAELLRQWAGDDVERRCLAGLVLVSKDWCWSHFVELHLPQKDEALAYLRTLIRDGDAVPEALRMC